MDLKMFIFLALFAVVGVNCLPLEEDQAGGLKMVMECGPNEYFQKCSLVHCYKTCDNLKHPPPCPSVSSDCYMPSCECKDGRLRNSAGDCVPTEECD